MTLTVGRGGDAGGEGRGGDATAVSEGYGAAAGAVLRSTGVTMCNTHTGCPILLQEYSPLHRRGLGTAVKYSWNMPRAMCVGYVFSKGLGKSPSRSLAVV